MRQAADDGCIPPKLGYCFESAVSEIKDADGYVINLDSTGSGDRIFHDNPDDCIAFEDNEDSFYLWSNQFAENFIDENSDSSDSKTKHVFRFEASTASEDVDDVISVPIISLADYKTILFHAEKISNGQHDFCSVLRHELKEKLNIIEVDSLIEYLKTTADVYFLNRVRTFLFDYPFVVEGEEGVRYKFVKYGNVCELDLIDATTENMLEFGGYLEADEIFWFGDVQNVAKKGKPKRLHFALLIALSAPLDNKFFNIFHDLI